MRIAYFDCFNGAAGDMIVAALVHAGADSNLLSQTLRGLHLDGYRLSIEPIKKQGLASMRFVVNLDKSAPQPHRHLKHIVEILNRAELPSNVRARAILVFERLASAEAKVHGTTIEKVHFHEVGAVDAVLDVVGAVAALDLLKIQSIQCSPIPVGSGIVHCEHGVMPVPAPATAELLKGVPLGLSEEPGELTTPTGAAILTALAESFGPIPPMSLEAIGYGAGMRDGVKRPNVLRVLVGEATGSREGTIDEVSVLEANIDDIAPEVIGYCLERLMAEGALDAFAVPIHMKKWRTGVILTVLCEPGQSAKLEAILFSETSTFGVRRHAAYRTKLTRRWETIDTRFGEIKMKIGQRVGLTTASPEFESCKAAATQHGVPLKEVLAECQTVWRTRDQSPRD